MLRQNKLKLVRVAVLACVMVAILSATSYAQSKLSDADVAEIVDRIDRTFRSTTSFASVEMKIETPNWERTLKMSMWTEGLEKTFVNITSPRKDKGISTLRSDTEMWNYFPKINKVMKIPPSMMMGSWMGSDFTNDDLVKESSMQKDYSAKLLPTPEDMSDHYFIEFIPRENSPIVWGKIIVKVRKSDYLPVREEFFDEKGKKMRVMILRDIKPLGGRTIPTVIELTPLNKKGNKTTITYTEAEFDVNLPDDTFTLRNLQKRR